MKYYIFLLITCFITFFSCNNSGKSKNIIGNANSNSLPYQIDLEKNLSHIKSIPLSSIGKELEYIPLETNPACLIQKTDKIVFSDSFIFVSDTRKVLQFDINGRFVNQIGSNGRGPGEYGYVMDICSDQKNKKLFILSYPEVLEFDFNGFFIRSLKVPRMSSRFILQNSDRFIFYQLNIPGVIKNRDYSWYITDSLGIIVDKIRNTFKRVKSPSMGIEKSPLYSFDKSIHLMEFGSDTLFYLKNKTQQEIYAILDLGKMKMEHDFAFSQTDKDEDYNRLKQKLRINGINEDRQNIYLELNWGFSDSSMFGIFNKRSLETIFLKENGFKNDIDGGLAFWPKYILNDSILVDYIDAFQLLNIINGTQSGKASDKERKLSGQLEVIRNSLTQTSNPVLIIVK